VPPLPTPPLPAPEDDPLWFQRAVFYEVFIRGFFDANNDGVGDIPGLIAKLDYLQWLGVDCLWLLPFYPSPLRDGGYDISDYTSVHPESGTVDDIRTLLTEAHARGIRVIADLVINHNSGADEEEINPLDGKKRWTRFNPQSKKFPRDWNCFHPSRYERIMIEGENFAEFPHLCHRNPRVYEAMFEYARLAIEELDFDGLRFDFVKGFGPWMVGVLAKYQYQKKDGREFTPFVVGEYWAGPEDIDGWLDAVLAITDRQIAAFDFPLRYKLKDVCDTPNYDLRNLTDGGAVSAGRPFNAVTFVENHDTGGNGVENDKMLGYSFILTGDVRPLVMPDADIKPPIQEDTYPDIFRALEKQLGLRLVRKKVPGSLEVTDRVLKTPEEN